MIINIDFRFIEILTEIEAFMDYLKTIEEQIELLSRQRRIQMEAELKSKRRDDDEAEISIALQELEYEIEHIYPKFFRGTFIVNLWAVYEAGVSDVAHFIQEKAEVGLRLSDIRGSDFLEQIQKYYKHVLSFQLFAQNTSIETIKKLYALRNGVAHANGRLNAMKETTRKALETLIASDVGLKERNGDVIIEAKFLDLSYEVINRELRELIERARNWDDERNSTIKRLT